MNLIAMLADADESLWLKTIFDPPVLALLIAPLVLVGGIGFTIFALAKAIMHHRERMAKIQQGIDPDAPHNLTYAAALAFLARFARETTGIPRRFSTPAIGYNVGMRSHCSIFCTLLAILAISGCDREQQGGGQLEKVWGRQGISDGRLQRPRAVTIDDQDHLYIVDMTARIQVFTPDGEFLRGWSTPDHEHGRPTGLGIDRQGNILVADTHYYQLLIYSPDGTLLKKIGGQQGTGPGEYGFVTDAVQDSHGNYLISEYGENDRIHKVTPDGEQILEWGGHGTAPGQFERPQALAIDEQDHLWVADACNHRIQVFDTSGKLLTAWGESGTEPGQLSYPYGIALDGHGHVLVCEFGNHRIQKFTLDGKSLGTLGVEGRAPGELYNPWSLVLDHQGRIHVLDTYNHRVQRVRMAE